MNGGGLAWNPWMAGRNGGGGSGTPPAGKGSKTFVPGLFCRCCGLEGHKLAQCEKMDEIMRKKRGQANLLDENGQDIDFDDEDSDYDNGDEEGDDSALIINELPSDGDEPSTDHDPVCNIDEKT